MPLSPSGGIAATPQQCSARPSESRHTCHSHRFDFRRLIDTELRIVAVAIQELPPR